MLIQNTPSPQNGNKSSFSFCKLPVCPPLSQRRAVNFVRGQEFLDACSGSKDKQAPHEPTAVCRGLLRDKQVFNPFFPGRSGDATVILKFIVDLSSNMPAWLESFGCFQAEEMPVSEQRL